MTPGMRVNSELLLVGSLPPFPSVAEAMSTAARTFGGKLFALPDGEPAPRDWWVGFDSQFFATHPDVEVTNAGTWPARHLYETPAARLKPGVRHLRFGRWPRIDAALESYKVFTALQAAGDIPPQVRFQVGIPFPLDLAMLFRNTLDSDYPVLEESFSELTRRELGRLTAEIPPEHLAIQFEACFEVLDLEGVLPWTAQAGAWDRFTAAVDMLGGAVPEATLLGYHLCYGTFPEWPMTEAHDMSLLVRMANYAIAHSGRRVDWLHLPGPRYLRSEQDAYYQPLRDLYQLGQRVFLGIVLPVDGAEGLQRRYATASRYLDDFGVARYCGWGRQPGTDSAGTLREHAEVVSAIKTATKQSSGAAER